MLKRIVEIGDEEPLINLTPLIDVVFVVLIMFIVIAPLLEVEMVELASGGETALEVKESSRLTIHVTKNNEILFNKEPIALSELSSRLRMAHERYPTITPQLFHDRQAHFGTYQEVKNAAELAGFSQLDLVLTPHG